MKKLSTAELRQLKNNLSIQELAQIKGGNVAINSNSIKTCKCISGPDDTNLNTITTCRCVPR